MKVDESTLDSWSEQGAKVTSAQTYQTIKDVLEDPSSPYASREFKVFLQGSYGNDTNIRVDSDVDIVMCLTSTFYSGLSQLNESEKSLYNSLRSPSDYALAEFKTAVINWLTNNFGSAVEVGTKAITIKGSGNRRDADVLVCASYREYWSYKEAYSGHFAKGIVFWTKTGDRIVNYPKQHRDNLSAHNQALHSRLKPFVRIAKNLRNTMTDQGFLAEGRAPSYFIEGLLWNMPYGQYAYSNQGTVDGYMSWLSHLDVSEMTCANGIHWLVRPNFPTSWKTADFEAYRDALGQFWA